MSYLSNSIAFLLLSSLYKQDIGYGNHIIGRIWYS